MSFTRFHDDPARVKKQLEESTYQGRYFLNKPGAGVDLPFFEDPHLRLQGWGANLHNNTVNLESDLYGLSRTLNRDQINATIIKKNLFAQRLIHTKINLPELKKVGHLILLGLTEV